MKNPFKRKQAPATTEGSTQRWMVLSSGELLSQAQYRGHIETRVQQIISSGSRANDSILAAVVAGSVPAMVCVNYHSNVVSSIPIVAHDVLNKPADFVPMKGMLDNRMRWLIRDVDKSLSIWDYALIRKRYNDDRLPTLLEFLNPIDVRINTDGKLNILDYRLQREQITLELNEVIYISGFDLQNTGNSVSRLENCLPYTGLERGIVTHATSFFFNGATITGVVSIEGPGMSDEMFKKFTNEFKQRFRGADKAHNTLILERNVTYTPTSVAPADLAMAELSDQSKQFICSAFGINPSLVGLGDVSDPLSALSTFHETKRNFVEMEATPSLDHILDNMNTQWALTDFPLSAPVQLVSDSSAMAMMNDGISTDDMSVAGNGIDNYTFLVEEARGHIGYDPLELDDGHPIRNPAWANGLWADGTISLNQKIKMLGIGKPLIDDMIKVDGITYKLTDRVQVAEGNLEKLVAPPPGASPFGLQAPAPTALLTAPPVAEFEIRTIEPTQNDIVMVEGIARQLSPRLVIAIDLGDRQLLKLAQRELGRALAEQSGITWVAPENWRVELAHIDRWSPADIANMTRVIKWDFNKAEVWTGNYFVDNGSVYLSLGDTEATQEMARLVHNDLRSVSIESSEPSPAMAVKLAHGDIDESLLPDESALGSMPIVFTRIAAYTNDKIQHKWRLRAYYDKDNQDNLRAQRDELSKWQQRIARGGEEWIVECLPQHVVSFVRGDALEELRLLLKKFVEEDINRDPEGKFAPSGGGNGKDKDDKDKDKKKEEDEIPEATGETSIGTQFIPKDKVRIQKETPEGAVNKTEETDWNNNLSDKKQQGLNGWGKPGRNNWEDYQALARGETGDISSGIRENFAAFETAVENAPNYEGISWRGINVEGDISEVLEKFRSDIGNNTTFDTYSSASASARIAGGFAGPGIDVPIMFEIHSKQGRFVNSAMPLAETRNNQYELIFQPNSEFTIRDAYMGKTEARNVFGGISIGETIFVILEDS